MKYKNPIRILTPTQIKRLDPTTLKSIKKEILLHFQLTEDPTIERNGIAVDKNEVLQIFEELQQNLTLHLQIHKNKDLVHFLETGSMSFFLNRAAQQLVLDNADQQYEINGYIAFKLNQVTAKLLEDVNGSTPKRLSAIFDYTSKMASEQQDKSYNKAYVTLKAKVDDLPVVHPHPFAGGSVLLHKHIPELVDLDFYNCFPYLPGAFKDIGFMYAVWCHNNVVNGAIRRQNLFGKYRRGDLFTILEAYDIAENVTTSENFKRTGRDLREYLRVTKRSTRTYRKNTKAKTKVEILKKQSKNPNNKRTNSSNNNRSKNTTKRKVRTKSSDGPWATFLRWAFFSVILIRLLFTLAECSTKKKSSVREREWADQSIEVDEGSEKLRRNRNRNSNRRLLGEIWVGDNPKGWAPVLTRSSFQDSLVELDYEVAVMPTTIQKFATFIPEEVYDKYKGREMDFVLQVRDIDFPDQVFRHRFRYDLTKNGRYKKVIYDGRKNKNGVKDLLVLDRMRKSTKPIVGTITRYSTEKEKATRKASFEIAYDQEKAQAPREIGPHGAVNDGRFEKYNSYQISEGLSEKYKNLIMNNLNIVHYKSLKLGNFYTLKKGISYLPLTGSDLTEAPFAITILEEIKGKLNYYSSSNEDDIAICSLNGEGYVIRYFVDRKAKRVVRMQMAIAGVRGEVVEVIEVVVP